MSVLFDALSWAADKDGIVHKVVNVRKFVDAVLKNPDSPIVKAGIVSVKQVTLVVVANREENAKFVTDAISWLNDKTNNGVHFNVTVVARNGLLELYGDAFRNAVALAI